MHVYARVLDVAVASIRLGWISQSKTTILGGGVHMQ